MNDGWPLPSEYAEPYAEPFWEGANRGVLRLQYCTDCGKHQFFPRPWCQYCSAEALEWVDAEGEGRVYSYTVVRRAVTLPAFQEALPYVVGYVDLKEGPRICTLFADCDPSEIESDIHVEVTFKRVNDDLSLPVFRPATSKP
ncbi:Zn-ribbon domain-containing OB-fold protein [Halomicrococcus sp. NG-SE-24]|uniref:Zn-ribbon domain-containing OB-fold protein n=1 Tax=Halomicrococcus sp. NG-SE-24 TaxID=3436928 RepID=UPI003D975119